MNRRHLFGNMVIEVVGFAFNKSKNQQIMGGSWRRLNSLAGDSTLPRFCIILFHKILFYDQTYLFVLNIYYLRLVTKSVSHLSEFLEVLPFPHSKF